MPPRATFALISLLSGLSFSAAHITGLLWLGHDYSPLLYNPIHVRLHPKPKFHYIPNTIAYDETTEYARFTQEVLRGEFAGNTLESYQPYVLDPMCTRTLWWRDRLGPIAVALLALPFSGNVPVAFILADFLFPTLLAWVLLLFAWRLHADLSFAVLTLCAVLWFNWYDLLGWINYLSGNPQEQAVFARTSNPQFSIPLFLIFFLTLWRLRERPTAVSVLLVVLSLTLNFYAYFYSWTFALAMLASLPLAALLTEGWGDRRRVFLLAAGSAILAVLLAFPVWYAVFSNSPLAQDSFTRGMGDFTRRPDFARALPCILLLVITVAVARRAWPNAWLWMLFWSASLLAMNQQVLTGKKLHPDHYMAYFIEPFAVVFLLDLGFWWFSRISREPLATRWRRAGLFFALMTLLLGFGQNFYKLSRCFVEARPFYTWDPAFRQVVDLLSRPELRPYAYLTNDSYLNEVMAAYVRQKPLATKLMNPLTDQHRDALLDATRRLLESPTVPLATRLRFNPEKILLILNKHQRLPIDPGTCRPLLDNRDFLVTIRAHCRS